MISKPIIEETINLKETRHLFTPVIIQYQKQQQIGTDYFEWVHLVYAMLEDKPIVFYIRFIMCITEIPKRSFSNYVSEVNKSSFTELLYLVTYYGFFKENEANLSLFKDNNRTSAIASYLESTNGKLLYHYQVEQLYSAITNATVEEAITFRKAINQKRPSTFEKAKTMLLPSGESLFDVLTKQRFRDFTLYPKIKEAMELYTYLNS